MKILHVVGTYVPGWRAGGPIQSVSNLCSKLAALDHDVSVFTTNLDGNAILDVPTDRTVTIDGVKVNYYKGQIASYAFSVPLARALKKNVVEFDIIHVHSIFYWPTLIASHYCRKYKAPYVISPRGILDSACFSKGRLKKNIYGYTVEKRNLSGASLIHFTSEEERKNAVLFGSKISSGIVPNGLRLEEFSDIPPKDDFQKKYPELRGKKIILFLSRINWKKGMDILSKAFGRIAGERKDVHLLIAGPDDEGYGAKVRGWLKEEGVLDRVTFTGMLNGREKLGAFAVSDVFVLPSYSENFGMVAVEAMACRVPVVISNNVGIYKAVEQNRAGTVVQNDPESLYAGIKENFEEPELSKEMALNGRKLVEGYYDINKVADKMIEYYEDVVKYANLDLHRRNRRTSRA